MGIAVNIRIDTPSFERKLRRLRDLANSHTIQAARDFLEYFNAYWQKTKHRGRPGLMPRRGQGGGLLSSRQIIMTGDSVKTLRGVWSIGGERNPYARIQEFGGTVLPVKGKYLAIPLAAAKTAAGVSRVKGPLEYGKFSKENPGGLVLIKSKKGALLLMAVLGKTEKGRQKTRGFKGAKGEKLRSRLVPMFVLKKQVTIPPRMGVRETFGSVDMARARTRLMTRAMKRAQREAMAS